MEDWGTKELKRLLKEFENMTVEKYLVLYEEATRRERGHYSLQERIII
jgi:hypothetical protein